MSTTAYQGVWHSYGNDRLILTLDTRSASFLIVILVTWVQFVASATWPIVRFAFWSVRRRRDGAHDVFHAQRQVVLRNSSSSSDASWQIVRLAWSWRHQRGRFFLRAFPYAVLAALFFLSWVMSGLFVPFVSTHTESDMLLITYGPCGFRENSPANESLVGPYNSRHMNQAQIYAQRCYNEDSIKDSLCSTYPRRFLPFSPTFGGPCPSSNSSLCITTNATVIRFETESLNSNDHFGINAPPHHQIDYRRSLTCSPISVAPFLSTFNTTGVNGSLYFPPNPNLWTIYAGPSLDDAFTFQFSDNSAANQYKYDIAAFTYNSGGGDDQAWLPNATLFDPSTAADATLALILGWRIVYLAPVYDPIFTAGRDAEDVSTQSNYAGGTVNTYATDHALTAIFCSEQHTVCVPGSTELCTPPGPLFDLFNASKAIIDPKMNVSAFNPKQTTTVLRLVNGLTTSSIHTLLTTRGGAALLASQTLDGHWQLLQIPNNQWELEVQNWFATSLAMLQDSVFSFAAGLRDESQWPLVENPDDIAPLAAMCKTQRAPALPGYSNFDFVAILVIFLVGAGLMLVGICFDWIVERLADLGVSSRAHQDWTNEGLLQVHRVALETKYGVSEWVDGGDPERPRSMQKIWPVTEVVVEPSEVSEQDLRHNSQSSAWTTGNGRGYPGT